jgi:2-succinyl-5-enolpyruvyl-6-hydroxy-3-cyclohexene-1-carboxylate synthase
VRHVILSPGSRSAPLTLAFVRHSDITAKIVSDERSAAFIGLGMAQQLRQAIALVCTSGSAAYNYAPAVAEALYQHVPLIIFTADRPPEWIDQLDGQTIRQRGIYGAHVKASYELPVGQTEADIRYAARQVAEAINLSRAYPPGPVHLNVPIREPFYPTADETIRFDEDVKVITSVPSHPTLSETTYQRLADDWQRYGTKLIVGGQGGVDADLISALTKFSADQEVPVVADIISNLHAVASAVRHADTILAKPDAALSPDLLVTFGRSVISKNLKLFLRNHHPAAHWHIQPAGSAADTFLTLTQVIHAEPTGFFADIQPLLVKPSTSQSTYNQTWQQSEVQARQQTDALFADPFTSVGGFQAMRTVLQHLPDSVNLHLANSMSVRYANLVGLSDHQSEVAVFANRGTSGIDGSSSTAVGSALTSERLTVLLTGDMAFFYDRNAFWHNYPLPNLRIVLLNNHGGGIFRLIDGPRRQPELEEYFETQQTLTAQRTAEDFGIEYHQIDLTEPETYPLLPTFLSDFYERASGHAKLLEVITDPHINQAEFDRYRQAVR